MKVRNRIKERCGYLLGNNPPFLSSPLDEFHDDEVVAVSAVVQDEAV